MDGQSYGIQWIQHDMKTAGQMIIDAQPPQEEDILASSGDTDDGVQYLVDEDEHDENVHVSTTAADIDQIAAENLIFMARDGQMVTEIIGTDENGAVVVSASDGTTIDCEAVMQQAAEMSSHDMTQQHEDAGGGCCDYTEEYTETTPQMVTEEVITDDWVQHQGEERVEIPAEQIIGSHSQVLLDIEVPLPTMQDEYTALRPYPCDFCSRRFRKKASLNNHMVAHQHDRPNLCKLCGSRFFRRGDLINHLKAHAEAPEVDTEYVSFVDREHHQQRHHHANDHYYDQDWSVNTDAISGGYHHQPSKSSRKSHNASGNSSSTSTSTTVARRGRISRLKPKEENYTINETLAQSHSHQQQQYANVAGDIDYVEECQELQASTAAVKLTQDHSPAHQRHYPIIDDSKPFVCQQCGLAFAREKALLSHAKNHRNDSPHECNQCNEMFWDTATLQEHQKSHHFEESNSEYDPEEAEDTQSESESERLYGEFYCSECGMSFHRQDVLRRHARVHHKNTTDADPAAAAGNVEVDNTRDQHCCNTCGETFAEALDLLAHAEIHARYPPFKCVLCGETFFEEHTIKRHLQSQHSGEMTQNSCILCGKECRDRKALIKHAWDHSREKCHSCSKCGKNFHNKARLKRHMASHRDKSVICDVCHEEFPDGRTLSNHRHSHSATASGKLFPCHECGKTFGSRSSQQIHVRIHTGERPYGCRFCWKAFADGGTLRKHERIHTGEKPYACAVCPRAFNQRVVLREHIRSHHSGLDAKRGTYFCTVCTADLSSSNDLIQHLIQHSDMNTAMQRQPVTGPRKYKRRRKLKPHEIARLRSDGQQNGSDIDISDFDMDTVDDLLGITVTTTNTTNGKSNKKSTGGADTAASSTNNNNNNSRNNSDKRSTEEDEDDEDVDGDQVARDAGAVSNKARYNSASSNSDKLWQTKLINSNDETYKSMLSNLENTLQSIDTLVVSSSTNTKTFVEDKKSRHRTYNNNNNNNNSNDNVSDGSSTAQRTQQVQIIKMETKYATDTVGTTATTSLLTKTRKKPDKSPKLTRPRMIHTEKSRIASSDGSRKRSKTYITRTEPANIELLPKSSSSRMVDDYEIISPDTKPPNQISSSPLHIKQENEQHLQQQQQHHHHSHTLSSRNGDLYDAQLLLEASTLRKAAYEKFNPSIVNDLEEILRSPIKSDRGERLRFTSESSSQFLVEPAEEEQHLIKIEPTSPDLREIVVGSSTGNSSNNSHSNTVERRSTRSTRSRLITANRKYLEFETDITSNNMKSNAISTTHQQQHKRNAAATSKSKVKNQKKDNNATISLPTALSAPKSYLNGARAPVSPSSSFASISAVVSAADANAAATAAAAAAAGAISAQPERKQRYFECEMCSAIFPDRAQLLDHVPIHI